MDDTRVHHPTPATTHDLARIRGDHGRYLRGLELADRKPSGFPWAERPARIGNGKYRVPSRSTDYRYLVDLNEGSCECEDHRRGHTCMHLYAAIILESRHRARMSRIVQCHGCPARVCYGDLTEVTDDHVEWGCAFFVGDMVCLECATSAGLL